MLIGNLQYHVVAGEHDGTCCTFEFLHDVDVPQKSVRGRCGVESGGLVVARFKQLCKPAEGGNAAAL